MNAPQTSTRPATVLMALTYAVGVLGIAWGFSALSDAKPDLAVPAFLAVGLGGILSFLRHAVFHHADGQRMGWGSEGTNSFQIEVGLANLAWGLFAVLTVVFDWGLVAQSASFLVFGLYMAAVAVFVIATARSAHARPITQILPTVAFAILLLLVGIPGMNAAT